MSETLYRVTFVVTQSLLDTVIGILKNDANIRLESATPFNPIEERTHKKHHYPTGHRYLNGRKKKGITGMELLQDITKGGGPVTREQLQAAMVKHGFAPTGLCPLISTGTKKGIIALDKDGKIRRAPKGALL